MDAVTALIVIPVFNTEKYILECLESIKAQTFKHFFCMVVDDGSTDHSAQIIKDFIAGEQSDRFIFFTKANGGVSSARNFALDRAQELGLNPDYVFFVDSDDYVTPDYLARMITAMRDHQCDYGVCGYYELTVKGVKPKEQHEIPALILTQEQTAEHFFSAGHFCKPDNTSALAIFNKGFKYSLIKDLRFNEQRPVGEDTLFFASCLKGISSSVILHDNLYFYRIRKSSVMHDPDKQISGLCSSADAFELAIQLNQDSPCVEAIITRFFVILYDAFKKAVYLKSNQACYFYQKLEKLKDAHGDLLPATHVKRIKRLSWGFRLSSYYLQLRKLSHKSKSISLDSFDNPNNFFE